MASQNHHQLHFVLFPLMCPGHFIPMVDMAKLLAQHGVTVTVITTPLIAARFRQTINRATASGLPLRILHLPFPSVAAGLPEGCESFETIPTPNLMVNFFVAIDMLQQPFEQLFQLMEPKPSCMIADKHITWVAQTGRKFRLPTIIFDGMSCFTLLCTHNLHVSKVHESVSESEPFVLPGLPDTIEVTKSQLPRSFSSGSVNVQNFCARVRAVEEDAYGMVVNSFEELEPTYMNGFRKITERLWCIGPLSLCNKDNLDKAQRGNKASIDENQCLKWLDTQESGTVIYACLGTLSRLTLPQLVELGSALELSKHPFVWVIQGEDKADKIDKWMEEDGFEERTKERGLIIRGWAPQVLILAPQVLILDHPAVGAFLTHCGWNSTLEGVCAGVPMITWPQFAEQFFNEKLVVNVLETGVSVGAPAAVNILEEDNFAVLIKREAIKKAVDEVMDAGIKGEERRKRARELGEMAKRAVEEGGSSYLNVRLLIQDVMQQRKDNSSNEDHNSSIDITPG